MLQPEDAGVSQLWVPKPERMPGKDARKERMPCVAVCDLKQLLWGSQELSPLILLGSLGNVLHFSKSPKKHFSPFMCRAAFERDFFFCNFIFHTGLDPYDWTLDRLALLTDDSLPSSTNTVQSADLRVCLPCCTCTTCIGTTEQSDD